MDMLPVPPHSWKSHFPMQKTFPVGKGSGLMPPLAKRRPVRIFGTGRIVAKMLRTVRQQFVHMLRLLAERFEKWRLENTLRFLLHPRRQPAPTAEKIQ